MLKPVNIIAIISITAAFTSFAQMRAQTHEDHTPININGYRVVVSQHCQQVLEAPLSAEQVDSYLIMKQQSEKMNTLERPIQKISAKMSELGNQIEALTQQAYVVTDGKLSMDKTLLAQQQTVSAELQQLADANKDKFTALEAQGKQLSSAAERFEALITPTIGDIEYSHVQVLAPGEQPENTCLTRN
ncbi:MULTISPECIES: hypothetical protein [Pseudoalteromonas]|uniref:Uncharacterized protein n=1 Tax=Pseudoalteromonas amylolytica TaxID=1859457 RepID=A0A1S1MJG5_9GAMM|nr:MULTISPECIES: hypothetical protein [Pseudoalteromonas]OHU84306.1 hypothetical protein BFC16_01300 [Pseudoalteromonas sp. JW3]OHU87155.1 hypothetical protein BET10_00640 [Pseudoalteromonas amylolytica]